MLHICHVCVYILSVSPAASSSLLSSDCSYTWNNSHIKWHNKFSSTAQWPRCDKWLPAVNKTRYVWRRQMKALFWCFTAANQLSNVNHTSLLTLTSTELLQIINCFVTSGSGVTSSSSSSFLGSSTNAKLNTKWNSTAANTPCKL